MKSDKRNAFFSKISFGNFFARRVSANDFLSIIHVRSFSVLVAINLLTAALGFVTTVKIANVLTKENFGQFAYALALGTYGVTFVRYGMDRLLTRDIVHHPEQLWKLIAISFKLRMILLFLVIVAILIFKSILFGQNRAAWGEILIVIASTLVALDMQPVYDAMQKMRVHAIFYLFQRISYFMIIWSVIVVNIENFSIMVIGLSLLLTSVFYLYLQYRWLLRNKPIVEEVTSVRDVFGMFKDYFGISMALLAGLSFTALTQLILKHISGPMALGGYAAGWQIVGVAMLFLNQVSRIGYPGIARVVRPGADKAERIRFVLKYWMVMLVLSIFFCLPLIIFPEYILTLLFRVDYVSEAATLRIMGIYTILYSIGIVASQYLIAANLQKAYISVVISGGLFSILMCFILIPTHAGVGAILALLVSHGISMAIYVCIMLRHIFYDCQHRQLLN